jgi:hypothetical protein
VVRKAIRGEEGAFSYPRRETQPFPKLGPVRERLDQLLVQAFLALAYMTPDDPRPEERAYRAGLRAFLQDERLDKDAPLETIVTRAEASKARSEAAQRGDCSSPVQAAVLVCGRRS